ncbi:hypothetical protein GPECTOR_5g140 [Gonium pectorale]|uniref:Protein kinase domain-containing protein n=1 Tax=Gonium pectorale TaxID=33097 RepID=A0A150GW07_GONPE|nr:hypothetical protein GPECTOR_5g140 [Gonium pectorale]|eukprot:KXZ54031.1 hypothetical protein GPECTOR_5g140 [Gonium pectorale]
MFQTGAASTEDAIFASPERMMEDIQILAHIGAGGFGVVYKGVYQGGEVAVKVALMDSFTPATLREALLGPQLRHPHHAAVPALHLPYTRTIVQVVHTYITRGAQLTAECMNRLFGASVPPRQADPLTSLDSDDGMGAPRMARHERQGWTEVLVRLGAQAGKCLVILVQEYCGAGNLHRAIQQGLFSAKPGHWSERVARRVLLRTASEVVRGMIHLHSAEVLHGDLKPANVLLGRSKKDRRGFEAKPANVLLGRSKKDRRGFEAKVADFGLAHMLGSTSKVESANWGTAAYTSPESFHGTHGKHSDVYSFGMLLWEMLTGQRPYKGLSPVQILMGVSSQGMRPEWPDAEWPQLCDLGRRCLAAEARERPTFRQLEVELVVLEERLRAEGLRERLAARGGATEGAEAAESGPVPSQARTEGGGSCRDGGDGGGGGYGYGGCRPATAGFGHTAGASGGASGGGAAADRTPTEAAALASEAGLATPAQAAIEDTLSSSPFSAAAGSVAAAAASLAGGAFVAGAGASGGGGGAGAGTSRVTAAAAPVAEAAEGLGAQPDGADAATDRVVPIGAPAADGPGGGGGSGVVDICGDATQGGGAAGAAKAPRAGEWRASSSSGGASAPLWGRP